MTSFDSIFQQFGNVAYSQITLQQLEQLRNDLKQVQPGEVDSIIKAKQFLMLLRKFREGISEVDKLHGANYPQLLSSLLSVGEDGLYSNNLRFIFELIQNVDDCEFPDSSNHTLSIHFDFNNNKIILRYNERGFTPFNVFAITGIAEAAKNVTSGKNEIGEKGIGFKSVFGVTNTVLIRSGWFSFELHKENFTIPVASYQDNTYCSGTEMTLFVPKGKAKNIYSEIKHQYCTKDALFSRNPLLFLNKLTSLKMYYDSFRTLEFHVSRSVLADNSCFSKDEDVRISVDLHDYENGTERDISEELFCTRYSYNVLYSDTACKSRYGINTKVGSNGGKPMTLQVIFPHPEYLNTIGNGALYSFLPTQLRFTVPVVCHVPFKLDASREFVDPQNNNQWFTDSCTYFSKLLDHAYQDFASQVKNDIVCYLPGSARNLFTDNNGKEKCLSSQQCFMGSHFSCLPVFYSAQGNFMPIDKIFCFDPSENIEWPQEAYRLLSPARELFLLPDKHMQPLGIYTERRIYSRLFQLAIRREDKSSQIFQYLDKCGFHPREEDLPGTPFSLSTQQVCLLMEYPCFSELFTKFSLNCLSKGKRPHYDVQSDCTISIQEALYSDFKASEAPKIVEKYLSWCQESCVLLDIDPRQYLPFHNTLVLSRVNPLASFSTFCYSADSQDTFSVRMKHKEISERLNQLSESNEGSAKDYLRELRNNRLLGRDAIGQRQYQNYIDLILQAGTSPGRFIQELLQNADDCDFPQDVVPEFSLTQINNTIYTQYNETGFTRGNIRSITAIGESTKNLLLNQNISQIGEKGVGFKTIFAIASNVQIHSGDFHFSLSAKSPTIPEFSAQQFSSQPGTKMEISLKNGSSLASYHNERDILELCLCLRKLRRLQINGTQVVIEDTEGTRTITINKRPHQFRRFTYAFTLDEKALQERENGLRKISPNQQIICYLPERNSSKDYPLYCGLPTKHRIKIPLIIDAPFMLTTSREEIETGSLRWNAQIRHAMYNAILSVIQQLKQTARYKVLRLLRFVPRRQGLQTVYVNDMFSSDFLNEYNFLPSIKDASILPTYDSTVFVSLNSHAAMRYPEALNILFSNGIFGSVAAETILDIPSEESLESTLNALGCSDAPFSQYFPVLRQFSAQNMGSDEFREALYLCLQKNAPENYRLSLRDLAIIPVYSQAGGSTIYLPWEDDSIFVKNGCSKSESNYLILNELLLPKSTCEHIFSVNVNEMNAEWERSRYNDNLRDIVRGTDLNNIYTYLLSEFSKGAFTKYQSWEILGGMKDALPLKNQLGELIDSGLFICEEVSGYFQSALIQSVSVHDECKEFARLLKYPVLSQIHYQDIIYTEALTEDEVEDLTADYFINGEEILRNFYRNGLLSDDLIQDYGLEYITLQATLEEDQYEFPEAPVKNAESLRRHIQNQLLSPPKIIPVKVERTIHRLKYVSGKEANLDDKNIRNQTLQLYTPDGVHGCCFCQKCLKVKDYSLMEVNNIIANPKYYFPQARVALCLECSKRFEALRFANSAKKQPGKEDPFLIAIQKASIGAAGFIDIPLGKNETIRFTATHLAEVQEILRHMPK